MTRLRNIPAKYRVAVGVAMEATNRERRAVGFMVMHPGAKIHVAVLDEAAGIGYTRVLRRAFVRALKHIKEHGRGWRYNIHANDAEAAQCGTSSLHDDECYNEVADLCQETRTLIVRTSLKTPSEEADYIKRCVAAAREHLRLTR